MGDDDENNTATPDRSARDSWLNSILGPVGEPAKAPPRANQDTLSASAAREFKYQLSFKSDFRTPADSKLTGVEVREVPEQVYAVSGDMTQDGTWRFACEHIDSVSFYADDIEGLRQSTAVVAKFLLTRDEDQRTWSEVDASQLILVKNAVEDDIDVPAAPPEEVSEEISPEHTPGRKSCVAALIELDVSIDADRQNSHIQRSVYISGLVTGAQLSAGQQDEQGTWSVPQDDLKGLAIIVPEGTPAFDINVALDQQEAGALIKVEVPDALSTTSENTLLLRLSPSSDLAPHRIRVFSDGREICDQVMLWGDDPDIPLNIMIGMPAIDDLPFELLIREETITKDQSQTANLQAAELNGEPLRLDDNLMRGNLSKTAKGWSWHGDLIFSIRGALASRDEDARPDDDAIPEIAPEITDEPDQPNQPKAPSSSIDTSSDDDVLVIQASTSDIERSGFIAELNALQAFIRGRTDPDSEEIYHRLGLTMKNWRDVQVIGPTGAEVALSSALPLLSPQGGRDNVVHTIHMAERAHVLAGYDTIEFRGLPSGCLLSHGRNLGQGTWRVLSSDILSTSIVGLSTSTSASVAQMYGRARAEGPDYKLGNVLVGGASRRVAPSNERSSIITIPLDPETFSPGGHKTLSLTIGDVPAGVLLTKGANHGDGVWTHETIVGDQLGFQILTPGPAFSVSITCVAISSDSADSTIITHRARIRPDRMEVVLDQAVTA